MVKEKSKGLTPRGVETKTAAGRYFDAGRMGLYLIVETSGAKRWGQRIVIRGKRCELGLGRFPVVGLASARKAALDNLRAVQEGRDPLQERREARAVLSFEEAARKVHEAHKPTWRNTKHANDFLNSLAAYAFPTIGNRKISEVMPADVLAVVAPIWTAKPETARRVRQRIGTVMKWAVSKGWRQDNPAENTDKALPKAEKAPVRRKALPYAEVADCIVAVHASKAWTGTKLAFEFLVLCAGRSGEVRGARWAEIDWEAATWEIPAQRMKTKRRHRVPLSGRAVAVLREAEKLRNETDLIFPSIRGSELSDMTLSKLVKELGFNADVHGFRTSFRTWAQDQTNFPREVCEAALAHAVGDAVEQAYARSDVFEKRRRIMQAWADYLAKRRGKVVLLTREKMNAAEG